MSRQKSTFGKLQRERDKQAKAKAKRERRLAGPEASAVSATGTSQRAPAGESATRLLEMIADVQRQFDDAQIGFEEYEERKSELLGRLRID